MTCNSNSNGNSISASSSNQHRSVTAAVTLSLRLINPCFFCDCLASLKTMCVRKVFEVCVETTVVVDTLGPARRRTHRLCVTVRCQWKKKDRLRQQESHNETICIAFAFPFVFIHCFMGSFHAHFHSPFGRCFEFWVCACACLSCLPACPCLPATAYLDLTASFCLSCPFLCFPVLC